MRKLKFASKNSLVSQSRLYLCTVETVANDSKMWPNTSLLGMQSWIYLRPSESETLGVASGGGGGGTCL